MPFEKVKAVSFEIDKMLIAKQTELNTKLFNMQGEISTLRSLDQNPGTANEQADLNVSIKSTKNQIEQVQEMLDDKNTVNCFEINDKMNKQELASLIKIIVERQSKPISKSEETFLESIRASASDCLNKVRQNQTFETQLIPIPPNLELHADKLLGEVNKNPYLTMSSGLQIMAKEANEDTTIPPREKKIIADMIGKLATALINYKNHHPIRPQMPRNRMILNSIIILMQ